MVPVFSMDAQKTNPWVSEWASSTNKPSINPEEFEPQVALAVSPFREQPGLWRPSCLEVSYFRLSLQQYICGLSAPSG